MDGPFVKRARRIRSVSRLVITDVDVLDVGPWGSALGGQRVVARRVVEADIRGVGYRRTVCSAWSVTAGLKDERGPKAAHSPGADRSTRCDPGG